MPELRSRDETSYGQARDRRRPAVLGLRELPAVPRNCAACRWQGIGRARGRWKDSHRLKSLSVVGGFLDGLRVDFNDGLNCLIGHRGTGKTTVLEFVRYAMDEFPRGEAGQLCRKPRPGYYVLCMKPPHR
jgi:hypothetical protein